MKAIDYSDIKKDMVAVRYRTEQNATRLTGIATCIFAGLNGLAIECYAGSGGLTEVYKQHFKEVINNDLNPESVAIHNYKAIDFVKEVVAKLDKKIDMIDFDCYGSPAFEIQEFFKDAKRHAPFVVALSDGFGLNLKFSKKEIPIRSRYLLEGSIDTNQIWLRHDSLIDNLISTLSKSQGLTAIRLCSVQTKSKNYVLAAYVVK
jgi:hypothetical protein